MSKEAKMDRDDVEAFLDREFPQLHHLGRLFSVESVGFGACRMQMAYHESQLRPGGTISGPSMMALADVALYIAVLSAIGPVALAVTTNFSINFLRKPQPGALIVDASLLKLGKRLAVGEAEILSGDELVAHVTATYSIPEA